MKFTITKYDVKFDLDEPYIQVYYFIADSPGILEISINYEGKTPIETILKALTRLYREDQITVFYKRFMYKTCNGYYQEYKRY